MILDALEVLVILVTLEILDALEVLVTLEILVSLEILEISCARLHTTQNEQNRMTTTLRESLEK